MPVTSNDELKKNDIPPGHGGPILEPNVNDVLSGRGGRINSHSGNLQFRQLVNQHKHKYLSKQTKKLDKVKIADGIVQTIRRMDPPGRFLKEDKDQNWLEIGDERARKKAGQAMREKAEETRKELQQHDTMAHGQQYGLSPGGAMGQTMDVNANVMQNQYYMQQPQMRNAGNQFNSYGMGYAQQQQQPQPYSPSNSIVSSNSFPNPNSTVSGQSFSTGQTPGYTGMSPLQMEQWTQEQRRMHASILKGNAVAFDREFHRMRSSESSGSRLNSLDVSSAHSNRESSSSSMMSALSSGVLSQNELLNLALQQQQLSNHMAVLDEKNEWNDKWNNADSTSGPSGPPGRMAGVAAGTGTVASGSVLSGSVSSGENNRRRMFQQSRGQSYLSSDLKGNEGGNQNNFQASQLMKESLGTIGSMNMGMGSANMSSMGMGSTNMMSSMNLGMASTNSMAQMRSQNMQRRMSAMGIDPMTTSDTSLMNLLADAAANSVSMESASTFSFASPIPGNFEKRAESIGSASESSAVNMPPPRSAHMNPVPSSNGIVQQTTMPVQIANQIMPVMPAPAPSNTIMSAPAPPVHSNIMPSSIMPSSDNVTEPTNIIDAPNTVTGNPNIMTSQDPPNIMTSQDSTNIEPIPLGNSGHQASKPPARELVRGGSSKSDVSMASNGSWYQNQVRNLGSTRNFEMNDSRLRLFSENSTR